MCLNDENIRYFIRGIIDGDGCIYFNNKQPQIHIASTYEQDWNYMVIISEKLNIDYSIRRIINKNNSHSIFYIGTVKNSLIFLNWLYKNYDGVGLHRK